MFKSKFAVFATVLSVSSAAQAAPMTTGKLTSQPIGHYEFCMAYEQECVQNRNVSFEPIELTRELWTTIVHLNEAINMIIEPRSDFDIYGREEVWTFPEIAGDCEDYVLLKRQMLIDEGISPANLLITVVRKPDGEGHAVLTVRTDRGEFILDNLTNKIERWYDTPYEYLKRQSERHAGHWVTIETPDMTLVGSIERQPERVAE